MHQARFLFGFVLTFLVGVFIASFITIPSWFSVAGFLLPLIWIVVWHGNKKVLIAGLCISGLFFGMWRMSTFPKPTEKYPTSNSSMSRVRDRFVDSLQRQLPEPHAGFLAGILLGGSSTVSKETKTAFQRTGTSHIIAVSGYNVSIIAAALSWLFLLVFPRTWSFWIVVVALIFFMLITGAQASVVRATFMGIAMLLARYVGRLSSPLHILVLAAGCMVALDPTILRQDIGFQLSFLATLGILVFEPILDEKIPESRFAVIQFFRELALVTTSAQLCVLPLLLYYFHSFAVFALPVNLLVLPFIPAAMLFGFLTSVAGLVWMGLGSLFASIAGAISWIVISIITWFADIQWAAVELPFPWYIAVSAYGVIAVVLWYQKKSNTFL